MKRLSPLRLSVHQLEDRITPTWGVPWYDPGSLTLSFVPDGTDVSGVASNLFSLLGPDTQAWQTEILRAYQTWAIHSNLNIGLVGDGGQAMGVAGLAQKDNRFGDIRIAARPLSDTVGAKDLAATAGFDYSGGTWSGDFLLNSLFSIGIGQTTSQYDLFAVALHEASHTFGFGDDLSDPSSVLWPRYTLWTELTPRDITAIQTLYGLRSDDPFEGAAGNGTNLTAFDLTENGNLTAISADVTRRGDVDVYRFTTPSSPSIDGLTINLRAAGISLLTARVTVLDEQGNAVASAATTNPLANDLTITLPSYEADTTYYLRVEGAGSDVFSVGAYALRLNYSEVYGNSFVVGSAYVNTETAPNESQESATTLGFTRATQTARFAVVGELQSAADIDWYRITPTTLTSTTGTLTVGVLPLESNGPRLTVAVFDAQGMELPSVVVVNENGAFTVQLANQQAGQTFFLRVIAANPTGTRATGEYALAASLAPIEVTAFGALATGTLTADQNQLYSEMIFAGGKLTQFSLTATTPPGAPDSAVRFTIINSSGQTVFTLVAEAGRPLATGTVWLSAGTYTVVFTAATRDGRPLEALTFSLRGREQTDPVDPYLEGPIGYMPPPPPTSPPPPPPPPPSSLPITVITIGTLVTIVPSGPINNPITDPYAGLGS